jgi:hypothetical protein
MRQLYLAAALAAALAIPAAPAWAARAQIIHIGGCNCPEEPTVIEVGVDHDEDGDWDEIVTFSSLAQAQAFVEAINGN